MKSKPLILSRIINPAEWSFHYGWVVVTAGTLIIFINTAHFLTFGVFLGPIARDTGWSRSAVSGAYAAHWMVGAVAVFGVGWFIDRFGNRRALLGGSLLAMVALILTGRSAALWQLYLFYGVLFGVARTTFLVPVQVAVGLWFRTKLGVAMGIVSVSLALGPLLMSPVLRYLTDSVGWGQTFLLMGAVGGILMFALSLLIPDRPADVGLKPYGEGAHPSVTKLRPERRPPFYREDQPDFFRYARGTQPFILLILAHFLGCAGHSIPLTHVVAMATDAGVPSLAAATILSMLSGANMVSNFGSSILSDRLGGKLALGIVMFLQTSGVLILLGAESLIVFYLFTLAFGLGFGGEMVIFPVINRQYYGTAPIGRIYSTQMMGAGVGMAGGAYVGGLLFDLMGDYTLAIWLSAALSFLGLIVVLKLTSPFAAPFEPEVAEG